MASTEPTRKQYETELLRLQTELIYLQEQRRYVRPPEATERLVPVRYFVRG